MIGALGPLQAGAGTGTLTVILKLEGEGTRVLWEYAYGGYVRGDVPAMAKAVDGVLAEQLLRLGKLLGARGAAQTSQGRPTPAPASAEPSTDSNFLREMEAGIGEANKTGAELPPTTPDLSETPPEKAVNDQGFVGRYAHPVAPLLTDGAQSANGASAKSSGRNTTSSSMSAYRLRMALTRFANHSKRALHSTGNGFVRQA